MDDKDIKTLIKVLEHKSRTDLVQLLENCFSEIDESGQFGSHWNSIISGFLIFAPVEQYYKLKELDENDQEVILNSVLDIYPAVDSAPEIKSIEFRILKEGENSKNKEFPTYIGRTVRVFVSYSTEDKELAGDIKSELERFGLEIFLAHEDINPSSDWQETILENLKSADIFMPIITEEFSKSFWTDQESGIAYIEGKLIIPIAVDRKIPYGFLGKFQAFRHNSKLSVSGNKIIESIIHVKPRFDSPLLDSLIKSFAISYSYDDAGSKSTLLLKFDNMSKEQINKIFHSALQNGQICQSWVAQESLRGLFIKYKHLIYEELVEEMKDRKEFSKIFNE